METIAGCVAPFITKMKNSTTGLINSTKVLGPTVLRLDTPVPRLDSEPGLIQDPGGIRSGNYRCSPAGTIMTMGFVRARVSLVHSCLGPYSKAK